MMNSLEFYTPDDIPTQIKAFDSEVKQLGVGKSGKKGLLQIEFQKNSSGKTIISKMYSEIPLHAQKTLHYDDSDLAYLYIMSASGGILQGDRYRIDICMKNDARAHITTQGATRVYSMNSNNATQMINVNLEENAYLEFIPDQIIPYRNSRFYQKLTLNVHNNATLIYSEIITPGRVAMGESFAYDVCYLKTTAKNQHGKYRFVDITNIEPKKQKLSAFGILGEYQIIGTIYILTKEQYITELYEEIDSVLVDSKDIFGGITIMKDNSGLLVRILGNNTEQIKDVIFNIVATLRRKIINTPFSGIRKT